MKIGIYRDIRRCHFIVFSFLLILWNNLLLADFSRDAVGVVADSSTGLAWQDDYRDNGGVIAQATWKDALNYCEALTLGMKKDWRLPNVKELRSIVDVSRYNPSIDITFVWVNASSYWSSSSLSFGDNNYNPLAVGFYDYSEYAFRSPYAHALPPESDNLYVRCVRGGE